MDLSKNTNDWIFQSNREDFVTNLDADQFLKNPDLFKIITESIQDGVCVLDDQLAVQYVNRTMEHWYDRDITASIGSKCHTAFHDKNTPCENCPVKKCFETTLPQVGVVHYDAGGQRLGLQMLYAIPVYNKDKSVKFVIEYVKDISIQEQYDQLIEKLQSQVEHLEKQNAVLAGAIVEQEVLHHRSEQNLAKSIQQIVEPPDRCVVRHSSPSPRQFHQLPVVSPSEAPSIETILSRREIQICQLILEDLSSKEIADQLCVTPKTIDFHRSNIRRKLNIDKQTPLMSFLRSQRHTISL